MVVGTLLSITLHIHWISCSFWQEQYYYKDMFWARRRGRRRKKLLDDLKDRRGYSHL